MKSCCVRIVLSSAIVMLFGGTGIYASTRVRFAAETVLKDPSVRIAAGGSHSCQVNEDGTVRCWGGNDNGQLGNGSITPPNPTPGLVVGLANVVAITAGRLHTCALLGDGTARCWGLNINGQLGDGTTTDRPAPVAVGGISNAVAISAGSNHTCAVLSNGTLRCWGANSFGGLGDGTTTDRPAPVLISSLTGVVSVVTMLGSTCALLADGTVRCSGYNEWGQVGDGTTTERHTPVAVSGLTHAVAIAGGLFHACALRSDGTVRCWGLNSSGQLGDGTTTDRLTPMAVSGLSNAVAISSNLALGTCALLADGTGRCWGDNNVGQLGDGNFGVVSLTPVTVSGLSNAVALSAGSSHACALLFSGAARCWGRNESGQLGTGDKVNRVTPAQVVGVSGGFSARDIATGRDHTCAVRANGQVACWGRNDSGQAGSGATLGVNQLTPVAVPGLTNVTAIAAGDAHTCALLAVGTVRCWGLNSSGQLGNGSTVSSSTPVTVSGLNNVVSIAAGGALGSSHTCALVSDGKVRCWGANGSGQLGDGTTTNRLLPVAVRTNVFAQGVIDLGFITGIAVGEFHSCAVRSSGSAYCWGANGSGQLGNGTLTGQLLAVPVSGVGGIAVSIAAGDFHTCILAAVGVPFCWGENSFGQLGDATQQRRLTPTLVSLDNTVAIAGGFGHSCALVANGTARCWGDNSVGQLGNKTTSPSWFPAPVLTTKTVSSRTGGTSIMTTPLGRTLSIATGRRHSCALLTTGGVSCWGDNSFGQLGLASTALMATEPRPVPSFTLNIDPTVTFNHNSRVTTVTVVATCDAGERLFIDVTLTQGTTSGRGSGTGECTGGLERYPIPVPALGPDPLVAGPAQVSAEAVIRANGLLVDVQEWTRAVTLVSAP